MKKQSAIIIAALGLSAVVWFYFRPIENPNCADHDLPTVGKHDRTNCKQNSSAAVAVDLRQKIIPPLTDQRGANEKGTDMVTIAHLKSDLLIPVESIKDEATQARQVSAMGSLCRIQTTESIATLMLMFDQPDRYFRTTVMSNGAKYYTHSYDAMDYLNDVLDGTPQPMDGIVYGDKDIPRFVNWWAANRDHLRFKPLVTTR